MKNTTKRALTLLLAIIMFIGLVPKTSFSASAAYYSNSQLSSVKNSIISNKNASDYVNSMMAYYLKNNERVVERNLRQGKSVVFFFDGCSQNVFDSGFAYKTNHRSAYVAVVKQVNGVPTIVFESNNGTTIPDNPRDRNLNYDNTGSYGVNVDDVPVVKDGIHNIVTRNHSGYAALHVEDSNRFVSVVRCNTKSSYNDSSKGINIHARSSDTVRLSTSSTRGSRNSTGCFNVGLASDNYAEYNRFIKAVTGKDNAKTSSHSREWIDEGVVIVDRYMYIDKLKSIYNLFNNGDDANHTVDLITEYSRSLNDKNGKDILKLIGDIANGVISTVKDFISNTQPSYISHSTSAAGVNFIKQFEGLRTTAYKDSAGVWTIGYGHTGGVYSGMTITVAQAEQYLKSDLKRFEDAVNAFMKKHNRYITQEQFDALVSFTFNVGEGWTTNSSYNIYKYMSTGIHTDQQVKDTFGSWVHSGGRVVAGLVTRRAKEAALYLYGTYNGSGGSATDTGAKGEGSSYNPGSSTIYSTGNYRITANAGVNVRKGPGTNYSKLSALAKNTTVSITNINGNWGQCSAGWICLDYAVWVSSLEPVINVPAAPYLSLISSAHIPTGKAVTVTWNKAADADCYDIYLKTSSGAIYQQAIGISGTSIAFTINNAGSYTVSAISKNKKYTSSTSNTISITAHSPSTVTFVDWDGSILSNQTVAYGSSATAPANPSRYGWTFKKWVGNYNNVTYNQTVTAQYERNVYTVTFYDEAGGIIGAKQKIQFEGAAVAPVYNAPEGYTFLGWDKEFDYIETNLSVYPVIKWTNEDLPVRILSTTTAVRENTGYTVNVRVRNTPDAVTDGRIIVALKTEEGRLLSMTESAAFHLKAAADKTIEVFMPYNQAATIAEIYVVEKFSTAIPISEVKSMAIDQGTAWTNWSTSPNPENAFQSESRTEYRYRTKSTTTSSSSSLSGWVQYNSTSVWSNYGAWSDWTDSKITSSDSRQVETRSVVASTNYKTKYHYYRYAASENASTGSYAKSSSFPNLYSYSFDSPLETATPLNGYTRYKWWYNGTNWHGLYASSPYTTQEVVSYNYKTQYRYRDRTLQNTYYYYKWSDWSEWDTTAITASDTRQVESRTTYRYLANDPSLVADNSGVTRTISGYVEENLAGEQATLFIYKVDEASDFTNEYVGQTVIGNDGSYNFTFKLREEPSIKTGDYTVTLGIEGTSTAIQLDPIVAPKPQYTVTYIDWDGTILSTQRVTEGDNAVMPDEDPTREGYDFICWNDTATNIKDDLTVSPVYRIKTYSVVFVDWNKESVVLETYEHGQPLVPPEIEDRDDSFSIGWDAIIDGTTTVTRDMVITARYDKKTFEVEFLNEAGECLDSVVVTYGDTVAMPDDLDNENVVLLGWVSEGNIDYITEDLVVVPVYEFKDTVEMPTANIETGEYTETQTVELECETENAVIYYTLNGEDPLVEGIEYTVPFEVSTSAELRFAACAFEMNDSDVARKLIAINNGEDNDKHIVEFIGNGVETEHDSFFVEDGNTVGFTNADFEIEGYDFLGAWYGSDFSSEWNLQSDVVTDSMTICLSWNAKVYTVEFIGYDDEIISVQEVSYSDEAVAPECEDVEGYVFAGFECDSLIVYGDRTITARYIPEDEYVAVSLNKTKYRLSNGTSYTLTASLSNTANDSDQTILWCSSDENIVMVSDDGTITANGTGTAKIYAVYAGSGSVAECEITVDPNIDEEIILITNNSGIGFDSYGQIRGIGTTNNTVSYVKQLFANDSLVFISINGQALNNDSRVGTGTVIRLMEGSTIIDEKTIVITGDMNGDGIINNRDASMIARYLVDKEVASVAQLTAIDVNGDGHVNNRDASMVSRYLVGKELLV